MTEESSYLSRLGPMPAAGDQPPPPPRAPAVVLIAFRLWIASLVVDTLGLTLPFIVSDPYATMQQAMLRGSRGRGSAPFQSHAYLTALLVMSVAFGIVGIALRVFLLVKMRAGRNWARIVLTVLFALGLLGGVLNSVVVSLGFPVAGTTTGVTLVGTVVALLLEAAAVVLMYRPVANGYFHPPVSQPPVYASVPRVAPPAPQQPLIGPARESYASWPTRALGGVVDYGIPTVVFFLFYLPFGFGTFGMGGNRGLVIMLAVILVLIVLQLGNSALLQGRTGQSVGKRLARTWLIDEWTGQPLGAGRAFGRLVGHFFDSAICYLGWLFPLWDAKRQTIADKLVHGVVVSAGQRPGLPVRLGDGPPMPPR